MSEVLLVTRVHSVILFSDSESLLEHPRLRGLQGRHVLLWVRRGAGEWLLKQGEDMEKCGSWSGRPQVWWRGYRGRVCGSGRSVPLKGE